MGSVSSDYRRSLDLHGWIGLIRAISVEGSVSGSTFPVQVALQKCAILVFCSWGVRDEVVDEWGNLRERKHQK